MFFRFKLKFILALFVFFNFLVSTSYALIVRGVEKTQSRPTGRSLGTLETYSTFSTINIGTPVEELHSRQAYECRSRDENVSLSLISAFSRDRNFLRLSEINLRENNFKVSLSPHLKSCFVPKISISNNLGTEMNSQRVRLLVKNEFDIDTFLNSEGIDPSGMSMDKKIEVCLKEKGHLSCSGSPEECFVESYTDADFSNPKTFPLRIPEGIDETKPLKLVYGSPYSTEQVLYGEIPSGSDCYVDEDISIGSAYIVDADQANTRRLFRLCESGDLSEIQLELEKQVRNPELERILTGALRRTQEEYAREKYTLLENIGLGIKDADNEDEVRALGRRYVEVLNDLQTEIIDPLKEELEILISRRRSVRSPEEIREIDQKIERINEIIGHYSDDENERTFESGAVIDKFLQYGFTSLANDTAEFKLNSFYFSRVNTGVESSRKGQYSFSSAQRVVDRKLDEFRERSDEAKIVYYEKTGVTKLSPQIQQSINSITRERDLQYARDIEYIQTELANCQRTIFGFTKNPVRCQNAMKNQQNWYRQALSKRAEFNGELGTLNTRLERYLGYEREAEAANTSSNSSRSNSWEASSNFLGSYGLFNDSAGQSGSSNYPMVNSNMGAGATPGAVPPSNLMGGATTGYNPYQNWGMNSQQVPGYQFRSY